MNIDKQWGIERGEELSDLSKVGADKIVAIAEEVGAHLGKGKPLKEKGIDLKVNQIRKFLDAVRRIETQIKGKEFEVARDSIILLLPKLAYAAGREPRVIPLMNVLQPAIKSAAQSQENFHKLLKLVESIIAYHRFYGGSN